MKSELSLVQLPVSHYCEKVRWALDHKGLSWQPENLVPVLHMPRVWRLSRQTGLPILRYRDEVIVDSHRIIDWLEEHRPDPSLAPARANDRERCREIEALANQGLGPPVRLLVYFSLLQDPAKARGQLGAQCGAADRSALRLMYPVIAAAMRRGMRIDSGGARWARDKLSASLSTLRTRLGEKDYFCADRFSRADLTVAALLGPLYRPPESCWSQQPVPEHYLDLAEEFSCLRDWVLMIYARHRQQ